MTRLQCFVVNLEQDKDRKEGILKQLSAFTIPHEIFPAVDGRTLPDNELARVYDINKSLAATGVPMTRGEIGCSLSHLKIYEEMVARQLPYALILEDDAQVGADIEQVLDMLMATYDAESDTAVLLNHVPRFKRSGILRLNDKYRVATPYRKYWNTHGYFLTLGAARKMAKALRPVYLVADSWKAFQSAGLVDVKMLLPYCVGHSEFAKESKIHDDREEKWKKRRRELPFFLYHYLYEKFIYQLFVKPLSMSGTQKRSW